MKRMFRAIAMMTASATALTLAALPAAAQPAGGTGDPSADYSITVGSPGPWSYPDDSPASSYIDTDGTFYFQQAHALYGATASRNWTFYTGTNFDDATPDEALNAAVNPDNPKDSNADTTWRCNNSPTGVESTYAPAGSRYAERNYCDLIGVWVDPDTGDWYGLVHNEFTPEPFNDGLHYDAIDYAKSTDQGRTWTIEGHAITSPYSTKRGDTQAFPQQTYYYGDGDPRLFVDTASGYFYLYYGSRVVNKGGSWVAFYAHVARAPLAGKLATGSWHKFYDGAWSQPGVGGKESDLVPVTAQNPTGYTAPADEYDPSNPGTAQQQVTNGSTPPTSPLFVMNIVYDAALGLYLGTPQAVDQSGNAPQQIYATDNLATQKWQLIGDTGSYHTASWYRWIVDSQNKSLGTIVGDGFRLYCSIACADGSSAEYVNLSISTDRPAGAPVDLTREYRITSGTGSALAAVAGSPATSIAAGPSRGSRLARWYFVPDHDGSYLIINAATGKALGVDATSNAGRAWNAKPTTSTVASSGPTVGQQWFLIRTTDQAGSPGSTLRIINRYSGLDLALTTGSVLTSPSRYWANTGSSTVDDVRSPAPQTMTLAAIGSAPRTVAVSTIGAQSWTVGQSVNLQVHATSNKSHPALRYAATGLPDGLSIDARTGLISGTPTTMGTGTATVTVSAANASTERTFTWTVAPQLDGVSTTLTTPGGLALQDPNGSMESDTILTVGTADGSTAQTWTFQAIGNGASYTLVNNASGQCLDDSTPSTDPGHYVIQWPCVAGNSNQAWKVTPTGNGTISLTNTGSGLLITASADTNGATVIQDTDTGSALQHWKLQELG